MVTKKEHNFIRRNALDEFDLLREAKTIMNTLYRKAISYKINIIENYKMKI